MPSNYVVILSFFAAAWLFLCPSSSAVQSVNLSWDASPSAEVAGFRVYYGTESGVYPTTVDVGNVTELKLDGFEEGLTYYFALTAYDAVGQESDFSDEIAYAVPGILPSDNSISIQQPLSDPWVTVNWDTSFGTDISWYAIYYGTESGVYDNGYSVGANMTSVDIWGLTEGVTYYFVVIAYDSYGQESGSSPEAAFTYGPVLTPGPVLALQQIPTAGFPNSFSVTATGVIPASWQLEASSDLTTWQGLTTGVESDVNVTVVVAARPALFFRLSSWYSDIELQLETGGTNRLANSLVVTTPYAVPWEWTLEASEDFQNWRPLVTGFFSPVKVAIITASTPALFFRLKGG